MNDVRYGTSRHVRLAARYGPAAVSLCVTLGLILAGCAPQSAQTETEEPRAKPIVRTADRGPVKLTVTADRDRISIAQRLHLTVEVEAAPDVHVDMPDFGAELNQFAIREFEEFPAEETNDGRRRYRQQYELDIFLSGQYEVPAITATYRTAPEAAAKAGEAHVTTEAPEPSPPAELSTEPFTIEVTSLLEGEFDPTAFRDVKGVATLPRDPTWVWVWWIGGGLAAVAAAVIAIVSIRRWHRRPRRVYTMPPHEWALGELVKLAEARLVEEGRVREFHYRLSEIARTYIELRFALMAPERTTEEFLREIRSGQALPAAHQALLAEFLEACDMVKYALYEPETEEIEHVFNTARDFIEQTKPAPRGKADAAFAEEVAA
jgi:hypothetical protein